MAEAALRNPKSYQYKRVEADPITFEVIHHRLISISDEQAATLAAISGSQHRSGWDHQEAPHENASSMYCARVHGKMPPRPRCGPDFLQARATVKPALSSAKSSSWMFEWSGITKRSVRLFQNALALTMAG